MQQLQSSSGTLLSEQVLGNVADAREALEKADAAYNTALDKLEAEDSAARRHSLRRQRLEISWRLVFGVDMQQLVAKGDVQQLEQLLPQVAYGNILAEDPASLAPRHLRQLVLLGQACLDYLWAICMETSRIIKEQVQQLATASAAIPGLTTSTEEMRGALAVALASCLQSTNIDMTATAASGSHSNGRVEREKTEAMRHTLEEATVMLEQLPLGFQQQQQQPPPSPPPVQPPVQQQQPPPSPKDLFALYAWL
ncbi:hypothetical protein OEZ86_012991 [Tetradesmus obliquus]|nr:hypothetical protein OEZ86_012991 [Tetradesmus obliquus]